VRLLICSERSPVGPASGGRLVLRALLRELLPRHLIRLICLEPIQEPETWMKAASMRVVADGLEHRGSSSSGERDHPGDANWGRSPHLNRAQVGRLARAIANGRPMHVDELAQRMRSALREELTVFRPDLVHVPAALAALGRDLTGFPSVMVSLDAEHKNVEAQASEFTGVRGRLLRGEAERMRRFEAEEYSRFARVVVVSEQDRVALRSANPLLVVDVIPNGVDTGYFVPPAFCRSGSTIVFHGVMNFAPNAVAADFLARQVLPLLRQRHRDVRLAIVGRAPTERVRALAGIAGVTITGEVEDVRPWLTSGRVYVCPMLSGTGIKNKLLEAMASGMPCVATPLALGGISAVPGRDILVARGASEIATQVERLLEDGALGEMLGAAARRYVETGHDWRVVARVYENVYWAARRVSC
jgi:polysaccharide biosynthesis protein PslH